MQQPNLIPEGQGQLITRGLYHIPTPMGLQVTPNLLKATGGKPIADAFDAVLYDRIRYKAGAAVPTTEQQLFTSGFGQSVSVVNAGSETYSKDKFDTNLQEGNRLPRGQFFVIDSIQAKVTISGETDTTYPTSGAGTEQPTDTTAAAAITGSNLLNAFLDQTYIQLWVGEKAYEEGTLDQFPSQFGISGFAGSGGTASTTAILNTETILNNGFGQPRQLLMQRLIPELVNFRVTLRHLQAFTVSRQLAVKIMLKGILFRPVQ